MKNIKKGDKIVCVSNKDCELTINKIYIVHQVHIEIPIDSNSENITYTYVLIDNDKPEIYGETDFYDVVDFIKLKEYRKLKLEKLNESNLS